jgi:hypothetical protein
VTNPPAGESNATSRHPNDADDAELRVEHRDVHREPHPERVHRAASWDEQQLVRRERRVTSQAAGAL